MTRMATVARVCSINAEMQSTSGPSEDTADTALRSSSLLGGSVRPCAKCLSRPDISREASIMGCASGFVVARDGDQVSAATQPIAR